MPTWRNWNAVGAAEAAVRPPNDWFRTVVWAPIIVVQRCRSAALSTWSLMTW